MFSWSKLPGRHESDLPYGPSWIATCSAEQVTARPRFAHCAGAKPVGAFRQNTIGFEFLHSTDYVALMTTDRQPTVS